MKKAVYALIILVLLASQTFAAADAKVEVHGSIEAGYRMVDDQNGNNARFLEYRDLDDNPFGGFDLSLQRGSFYLNLQGHDITQDDQSYLLEGTDYRNFAFTFFYDETPHNLSFDARAPYTGIGHQDLKAAPTTTDIDTFDYKVEREEFGGYATLSLATPFYLTLGILRRLQDGIRPLGSGDYWRNLELPEPVDYTTDEISLQVGYRGQNLQAALKGYWSTFDNENESMTRPYTDDILTLPPDNDYGKIAAEMSWRNLPLQSLLAVKLSYSKLESDISLKDLGLTNTAGLYRTTFDGDITYTRGAIALSSRPTPKLDTRIYFNYLDKDNDSNPISAIHATQIFDYREYKTGIDVGYDLTRHTKFSAGYEYLNVDRHNRDDAEETSDQSVFFEFKNSSLDFLTARLRYKRLERDSDFGNNNRGTDPVTDNSEWAKRYIRRFDVTDKSMDEIKLVLELYPLPQLDFGFEYSYKMNDYDETDLGLTKDKRHAIYTDFVWRVNNKFTLNGFAGYEKTEADSDHRQFAVGESADIYNHTDSSFNWNQERNDDYWSCGLAFDVLNIIEKLDLHCAWQYQDSDGEVSFSSPNELLENINQSDDYDLQKLEVKLTYAIRANTDITLGYLYEKYDYDDLQFSDYEAFTPTGTVPGSYLTGAYYDQDYKANVGYLMVSYNF